MASFEIIKDLIKLIQVQRQDVKKTSLTTILSLTADPTMCKDFVDAGAITPLCRLTADNLVAEEAISALINIGAEVPKSLELMIESAIISRLMEALNDSECRHNLALMLLVNLTTFEKGAEKLMQISDPQLEGLHMRKLIRWHLNHPCQDPEGPAAEIEDPWQHVATIVGNVTQIESGRLLLLRQSANLLPQLVPQLAAPNPVRRKGVLVALKNLCFKEEDHWWLINTVGVVPYLLYVIAGPEEYTFEEKVDLDPMVWSEGAEKVRDPDREVCKLVLEALLLLCTKRQSREQLRKMGVFPVIKHLDNSVNKQAETYDDEEIGDLVFQIVNFLMRDEEPVQAAVLEEKKDTEYPNSSNCTTPEQENVQLQQEEEASNGNTLCNETLEGKKSSVKSKVLDGNDSSVAQNALCNEKKESKMDQID